MLHYLSPAGVLVSQCDTFTGCSDQGAKLCLQMEILKDPSEDTCARGLFPDKKCVLFSVPVLQRNMRNICYARVTHFSALH